jgi:hypothetical protein
LIEDNVTGLALKSARNAKWIHVSPRGQGSDNACTNVSVQIIRRNHQAGTGFPYLATPRRIEFDENDVASP